jgi:error-prone DNA polymerase
VRLGLASVRGVGAGPADRIVAARGEGAFASVADLARRARLTAAQLEALATAGALESLEPDRRRALWAAGASAETEDMLPGTAVGAVAPTLPGMNAVEATAADLWATGVSVDGYPLEDLRDELAAAGIDSIAACLARRPGRKVTVAGVVTHRQRPSTAKGVVFLSLEDETGLLNVVCRPPVWAAFRAVGRSAPAVVVAGVLERADGAANVLAARLDPLPIRFFTRSRDFH